METREIARDSRLRPGRGKQAALACVAFLALFVGYAGTASQGHTTNDVVSACLASWRIADTHEPWLDDVDLGAVPDISAGRLWTSVAGNGHTVVVRSPGVIAAGVPAYALAGQGGDPQDLTVLPGALTAALLTTLAMALMFSAVRRHLDTRTAGAAVAALALTTPMWSVTADGLWTHAVTVVGIAGMAWGASRERWWLVGLFGGIALWGRLHTALIVAVLGVALALWRRQPRIALRVGAVSGAFMVLASVWSHWLYGTWSPAGAYGTVTDYADKAVQDQLGDQVVNELGLLVAPDRGLLVWTPVLVLLLPAVVRAWRSLPDWTRVLALGGVAYALVQGLMNVYTGGSGFYGYRLTLETLACVFPAYALSLHRTGRVARAALGPVLGLQLAAIAVGATSDGFFLYEKDMWTDNSFWLALRTFPELWLWVALMLLVGWLAGAAWRQRGWGTSPPQS